MTLWHGRPGYRGRVPSTVPASLTSGQVTRRAIGAFIGLAGVCLCLTTLFLSMRSVMDIGGTCATGGPYEIASPCPDAVGWLFPVSIVLGIVFGIVYVVSSLPLGGGGLAIFFWSALFFSLGWNFLEYGFDPPGAGEGPVWGWVVCGVLFWILGTPPLLTLLPSVRRAGRAGAARPGSRSWRNPTPRAPLTSKAMAFPDDAFAGDVVARLERLAALRASGDLDEGEYERAKAAVLGEAR